MLPAAFLLACGGPTTDTDGTDAEPTDSVPTETGTPTETGPVTTLDPPDAEALARSLQAGIDLLPRLSEVPCYAAWRAVSGDQDLTCPEYLTVGTTLTWESICTTDGGTTYGGILTTSFDQTDYVDTYLKRQIMDRFGEELVPGWQDGLPFGGDALGGIGMDGSVNVYLPGGQAGPDFTMGGQGMSTTVTDTGLTLRHHKLEGLCYSAAPTGSWLDEHLDPWIHLQQLSAEGDDTYLTNVDGSLYGLPAPYAAIDFEEVTLRPTGLAGSPDPADDEPAASAPCDLEPEGAIELRDEVGHVYRITFDPSTSCDGCGAVSGVLGGDFGTVCADFAVMRAPLADTTIVGAFPSAAPSAPPRVRVSSPPEISVSSPIVQEPSP